MPFSRAADNQIVMEDSREERGARSLVVGLFQRGVESQLPPKIVDGPDDLGLLSRSKSCGPNFAIPFVVGDVEAVNNGHAAGEFAFRFDVHKVLGLRSDDGRIQRNGHGDWIWQGYPVFPGLFEESFLRAAVALDGKFRHRCGKA